MKRPHLPVVCPAFSLKANGVSRGGFLGGSISIATDRRICCNGNVQRTVMGVNIYKYTWIFYRYVFVLFFFVGYTLGRSRYIIAGYSKWLSLHPCITKGSWVKLWCQVTPQTNSSNSRVSWFDFEFVDGHMLGIFWAYFGLMGTRRYYILYKSIHCCIYATTSTTWANRKSCLGSIADVIPSSLYGNDHKPL